MKIKDKSQAAVEKRRDVLKQAAKDCQQFCNLIGLCGVRASVVVVDGVNNSFIDLCYKIAKKLMLPGSTEIFSTQGAYYIKNTNEESKIVFNFSAMNSGFFGEQAGFNDEKQIYFAFCHEFSHLLFKEFLHKDLMSQLNKKTHCWSENSQKVITLLVSSYIEYEQKRDQDLANIYDHYDKKKYDQASKLLDQFDRDKERAKDCAVYNVGKFLKTSVEEAFADQMAIFFCSRVMSEQDLSIVLSSVISSRAKDAKESVGADIILKENFPDVHNTNLSLIKMFSDLYAVKSSNDDGNLNFSSMGFEEIINYTLANALDCAGASVIENYIKNPFFQDLFDESHSLTQEKLRENVKHSNQMSLFEDNQLTLPISSQEFIKNLSISLEVDNKIGEVEQMKVAFRDFIDKKVMLNWPVSQEEIKEFLTNFTQVLQGPLLGFLDQSKYNNKEDYAKWLDSLQYILLTTVEFFPDKEMNVFLNKNKNQAYLPNIHYTLFNPEPREILKKEGLEMEKKAALIDKIKSNYNSVLHRKVISIK